MTDTRKLITRDEAADYMIDTLGWGMERVEKLSRSAARDGEDFRKALTREQAQQIINARPTTR